ncbi:MAG: FGGY-family carbohydrate kinase [Spirochaetales bacterium]|nr:FGGY-family carbohydrate kinase [Spirochaetales bacterium]
MEYILSLDLGTSAIKVALFNEDGDLVVSSNQEYSLLTPTALSVEVEIETYWNAFTSGVNDVLSRSKVNTDSIRVIGISAQGETLIPVDSSGQPLRNAIVWMDNRAQEEAAELELAFKNSDLYGITGQVSIVPTWPASKILWIKKNEPEVYKKVDKYLLIEDYFIYRLTGKFVAEGSLLCSTVYWDIIKKKYWTEMLDYLGVNEEQLPAICESGDVIGRVQSNIAAETGLSTLTVVCTGVLDQVAGAIGVGNVEPGVFSECTGSALAIVSTVDTPFCDPQKRMPCHYHGMPDTYMVHTFTTGGMVLKWFRDRFCENEMAVEEASDIDAYELMSIAAAKVPPGSEGLIMLPHLQGAMAPENDPKAKGVFYGLTLTHTRAHFTRAIMESIAFLLRKNIEVIEDMGIPVNEIRSLGGGARSSFWGQLKADVTGKPVVVTCNEEEACLGAAIVAGTGIGMFSNLKEASRRMVSVKNRYEPNLSNKGIYDDVYRKYLELYTSLRPMFAKETGD